MNWTKIPTNILINRYTDQEIISIVKYQLLWADLEYKPDEKTALRYLTKKQLAIVKQYEDDIETCIKRDIHSVEANRNNVKINYLKNKDKKENLSISLNDSLSNSLGEQIRLDNIRKDLNNMKGVKLKSNQYLIDSKFSMNLLPDIEIYRREVGDNVILDVYNWLISKKKGKVVDYEFICRQIVNFSKRQGLI